MSADVEMVDRTGMPRRAEEFAEARKVIMKRLVDVQAMMRDPELGVQLSVIREALLIAEAVATAREKRDA